MFDGFYRIVTTVVALQPSPRGMPGFKYAEGSCYAWLMLIGRMHGTRRILRRIRIPDKLKTLLRGTSSQAPTGPRQVR